jgi:hypothetical protein
MDRHTSRPEDAKLPVLRSSFLDDHLSRSQKDRAQEKTVRSLVETGVLAGERGAYRLTRPVETLQVPTPVQAILAVRFGLAGLPAALARFELAAGLADLGQFTEAVASGEEGLRLAQTARSSL